MLGIQHGNQCLPSQGFVLEDSVAAPEPVRVRGGEDEEGDVSGAGDVRDCERE
jgi:hypothetical protein